MKPTGRPSKEREVKSFIIDILTERDRFARIRDIREEILSRGSKADYMTIRKYIKQLVMINKVEALTLTESKNGRLWVLYKIKK